MLTEHPNAAGYRQAVGEMLQGNLGRFRELLADDVVWYEAGNAEPIRGRDAVMEIFSGLMSSGLEFDDDLRVVLADDEHLFALIQARIGKGDAEIVYPVVEVAHFQHAKMTERRAFMDAVPADVTAFFAS